METLHVIAVIAGFAALNRFCGVKLVPGKPLLWVVPFFVAGAIAVVGEGQSYSMPCWLTGYIDWLPSAAQYWLLMAAALASIYRLPLALAFAFWFWRVWEWGRWIDLGSMPDGYNRIGKKPTPLERMIGAVSGGNDYVALGLRHCLVIPGLALAWRAGVPWWIAAASPLVALAFLGCYAGAKWLLPRQEFVWLAELGCGAIWGVMVLTL